jgi:hypothetical protein
MTITIPVRQEEQAILADPIAQAFVIKVMERVAALGFDNEPLQAQPAGAVARPAVHFVGVRDGCAERQFHGNDLSHMIACCIGGEPNGQAWPFQGRRGRMGYDCNFNYRCAYQYLTWVFPLLKHPPYVVYGHG